MFRPTQHRTFAALVAIVALGLLALAPSAGALPAGFTDVTLPASTNPLSAPTDITPILNTGRALVLEKAGTVRILQADGTLLAGDALSLSNVCTNSEEGLLGAAVDPGFATNGYIYLYYTADKSGCIAATTQLGNRVSRFTMSGNTINPASELVLIDNMYIPAGNHNGGDLQIGKDGDLYVSVGDGGLAATSPRGSGAPAAQDLSILNGKILRITTTGGIPADNPFAGGTSCATTGITTPTTAQCAQIYDYGLRNPFRFAMDPDAAGTRFFINDVGEGTWEEVDAGGSGLNYGWPTREGFCTNGSSSNCTPAAGFTDPLTAYNHSTGCTYITAGAFIPNRTWAAVPDGGYLFADGGCGKIFLRSANGTVNYSAPFATTTGLIVDMTFLTQGGQTQLYYVTNGSSQIHRISGTPAPPLPVVPPVVGGGVTPSPPTTSTTTQCTSVKVKGKTAKVARGLIRAAHCTPFEVVVKMHGSKPALHRHQLVPAKSSKAPKSSPGRRRQWSLVVQHSSPVPGAKSAAGARETIWAGWVRVAAAKHKAKAKHAPQLPS